MKTAGEGAIADEEETKYLNKPGKEPTYLDEKSDPILLNTLSLI